MGKAMLIFFIIFCLFAASGKYLNSQSFIQNNRYIQTASEANAYWENMPGNDTFAMNNEGDEENGR